MTAVAVRACYAHRYDQLSEEGRVDARTKIIDKDRVDYYESADYKPKVIGSILGVTKEDLAFAKELERSLVAVDRERALSSLYPDADSDAPVTEAVVRDVGPREVAVVVINGTPTLYTNLIRMWCEVNGHPYSIVLVQRSSVIPDALGSKDFSRVLLWSRDLIPEDSRPGFDAWAESRGRDFVVYLGSNGTSWSELLGTEDRNDTPNSRLNPRWIRFCWMHERNARQSRISCNTRLAELEDVMDCGRLGIPMWAVAKAIGVPTSDLRDALESEGCLSDYGNDLDELTPMATAEAGEVQSESEAEQEAEQEAEPEPVDDASQVPQSSVGQSSENEESTICIREPLITRSGAASITSTINDGRPPSEDLWTRSGDGWIIRSYRANIAFRDGIAAYCNGTESRILRVNYSDSSSRVRFDRDGLVFEQVGHLNFILADRTTIGVPVVSDYPVRTKRWLA